MNYLPFVVIGAIVVSCTAPVKRSITDPSSIAATGQASDDTSASLLPDQQRPVIKDAPEAITPPEWIGKKFTVLPKQQLLCAQGYQFFTCKDQACDTAPIDTQWENNNHRVRCSKLGGDSMFVETVEPDGDEWLVTFAHIPTEKRLYARTRKQAISEIAFSDDLYAARKRWLQQYVFSKKGVISRLKTTSSGAATITSKRIRIQDSLLVTNVRWGMTPLPVNPIWLMVKMSDGTKGFIPVRISWTNTMIDKQTERQPWDEDIYESSPAELFNWDDNTWEIINNHRVIIDMTMDQVTASWGYPLTTAPLPEDRTYGEIWTYPSHVLRFQYKKCIAIDERQ